MKAIKLGAVSSLFFLPSVALGEGPEFGHNDYQVDICWRHVIYWESKSDFAVPSEIVGYKKKWLGNDGLRIDIDFSVINFLGDSAEAQSLCYFEDIENPRSLSKYIDSSGGDPLYYLEDKLGRYKEVNEILKSSDVSEVIGEFHVYDDMASYEEAKNDEFDEQVKDWHENWPTATSE